VPACNPAGTVQLASAAPSTQLGNKVVLRESYLIREGWLGAVRVAFGRIHG
jgi:hypothetical protein